MSGLVLLEGKPKGRLGARIVTPLPVVANIWQPEWKRWRCCSLVENHSGRVGGGPASTFDQTWKPASYADARSVTLAGLSSVARYDTINFAFCSLRWNTYLLLGLPLLTYFGIRAGSCGRDAAVGASVAADPGVCSAPRLSGAACHVIL
ncbi:MAG: hypothetical protein IPM07_14350 [Anaerolineales bacterium]|nr:hypothetical protein [Anaerolineales bacterium]